MAFESMVSYVVAFSLPAWLVFEEVLRHRSRRVRRMIAEIPFNSTITMVSLEARER